MHRRQALVTDGEAAVPGEPRHRALQHPPMPTEPLLRLDALAGNPVLDVAAPARLAATADGYSMAALIENRRSQA